MTEDSGSLVAVGRDAGGLASWTSTDGVSWERHDVPDPTFIEGMLPDFGPQLYLGTRMGSLTRLGDTLFSFGTFSGPNDFYRPVGWRSPDGATWEFIESVNDFYGYGTVTDAEAFGDALLAARAVGLAGPMYSLWTWAVDTSWRQGQLSSTNAAQLTVLDVAVAGGALLAVGNLATQTDASQEQWPSNPVGWRSSDGAGWDQLTMPEEMELAYQVAAAAVGGFSVLGRDRDGGLSTWHTPDGDAWAAASQVCPPEDECDRYTLATAGGWLVLASGGDGGGVIRLSRDGMSWLLHEIPAVPLSGGPIAELGGRLVVFADVGTPDQPEMLVLRSTLAD